MSGRGAWHLRGVALPEGGAARDSAAGAPANVVTFATDPGVDLSSLVRRAAVLFAGTLVPLA
jgi:hypothetical protein